jgi:biopolymer transport protein ExbB/TolQ
VLGVVVLAALLETLLLLSRPSLRGSYIGVLLFERGWVQYAIMGCVFWSFGILVAKLTGHLVVQRRAFHVLGALEGSLPAGAGAAWQTLIELHRRGGFLERRGYERSLFFARASRAVEQLARGRKPEEVSARLSTLADADASGVDSSFAMLKVLVWAVPILGFIGTVLGIGDAVAAFSEAIRSANDLEVIKKALGEVTGGLAVAFDTTLLALVMSIVIMLPMSSLQLLEDNLLNEVDDGVSDRILARFRSDSDPVDDTGSARIVEVAIARAFAAHEAEFRHSAEAIRMAGDQVMQSIVNGWDAVDQRLQTAAQHQASENARALATVRETALETQKALGALQVNHAERVHEVNDFLVKNLSAFQSRGERAQERMLASLQETLAEIRRMAGEAAEMNRASLDELRQSSRETLSCLSQAQEGLAANAGEQLDRLIEVGARLVESLAQAASDLVEQTGGAMEVAVRLNGLQASQQALTQNLDVLARSEQLQHTLGGVQQALVGLAPYLSQLTEKRPVSSAPRRMWFFRS